MQPMENPCLPCWMDSARALVLAAKSGAVGALPAPIWKRLAYLAKCGGLESRSWCSCRVAQLFGRADWTFVFFPRLFAGAGLQLR